MSKMVPCPYCKDIWLYASVGDYGSGYESYGYRAQCKCGYAWRRMKWLPTKEEAITDWNAHCKAREQMLEEVSDFVDQLAIMSET